MCKFYLDFGMKQIWYGIRDDILVSGVIVIDVLTDLLIARRPGSSEVPCNL